MFFEGVDPKLVFALQTAIQGLALRIGDMRHWELVSVLKMEGNNDIYRIGINVDGGYYLTGLAFILIHNIVENIMLDTHCFFHLIMANVDAKLQTYTREHPWIAGL